MKAIISLIMSIVIVLIAALLMTFVLALLRINQPKTPEEQALEDDLQMQAIREMQRKRK